MILDGTFNLTKTRSKTMLRVALCVVILVAAVHCMPTEIEAKAKCGSTFKLTLEEDFRVISKAVVDTNDTCTFKFTSENTGDCKGTCYMFDHYAEIRDDKVALIVGKKTYLTGSNFPNTPVCSDDVTVDVTLIHASGYMHNTTYPNYKFKLNVYNKCGPKGEQYNLTFEDVISELDGGLTPHLWVQSNFDSSEDKSRSHHYLAVYLDLHARQLWNQIHCSRLQAEKGRSHFCMWTKIRCYLYFDRKFECKVCGKLHS
ncbi:uncharacterized protein LOC127882343 isoform X3 [Dreissena polymorpha]|uniref:uncharacterized protein LOC127882343 isoform X3 n=1 Tax=Dreissena polymorpha TaxID=45954 RepID=UPI0022651A92|nr:uncharacterized protein LOC127882343 isoform X3 [Dreissena polymorpha]